MKIKSKDIEAVKNILWLEFRRAQSALIAFKCENSVAQLSYIDAQEQIEEAWRTASLESKWLYVRYIGSLIASPDERRPRL